MKRNRIYIIGDVASGKTTFAKKLSKLLDIQYYELDCIAWNKTDKGRFRRTFEEQINILHEIDKSGEWIIEGTFRQISLNLLELAETVIFLDIPLWKRRYRILSRFIKQQLKIEKSHYKSDFGMLKMMFKWNCAFEQKRKQFENTLFRHNDKLVIITNPDVYIRNIKKYK